MAARTHQARLSANPPIHYGRAYQRRPRIVRGALPCCYSLVMEGIIPAWGRILRGYRPALSVEITRECPLRCPGCYAYGDEHLGGGITLREVSDFKGPELIRRFFELIDEHRPLHVSIVGGEPLVRFRELH